MKPIASQIIVCVLLGLCGCQASPDAGTGKWDGRNAQVGPNNRTWPAWNETMPVRRVEFGQPSDPPADRMEYARFAWDDSGVYALVYGFEFRPIRICHTGPDGQTYTIAIEASEIAPEGYRSSLGLLRASRVEGPARTALAADQFQYVDRGWVGKSGQCQSEFRISWKALGVSGKPGKTVISLADRSVTLTGQ